MKRPLLLQLVILFSYTFFLVFATINMFKVPMEETLRVVLLVFLIVLIIVFIPSESDLREFAEGEQSIQDIENNNPH